MIYHMLNGDSLANTFRESDIAGEIVIAREALIDGSLNGETLSEFWDNRAQSLGVSHQEYQSLSVNEFQKIIEAPANSIFHLWFGYDLFCQVNLWFVLSLIDALPEPKDAYIVYPTFLPAADIWLEFGRATSDDLQISLSGKVKLQAGDFELATGLWQAYRTHDLQALLQLSTNKSACFPYLTEVCKAHADRFAADGQLSRPERTLMRILEKGETDFYKVFREFSMQEGIYGFGDMQLKPAYDKLMAQLESPEA